MFRRVVSILLLPCLLLTQSAALGHGHGHGEGRPAGHDLRPHFHADATPARHTHSHAHHHGDGHRHHHHRDDDASQPAPASPPSPGTPPASDHDRDAVFVDVVDALAHGRSVIEYEAGSSVLLAPDPSLLAGFSANPSDVPTGLAHPPPPTVPDCPLYVRHLALLI